MLPKQEKALKNGLKFATSRMKLPYRQSLYILHMATKAVYISANLVIIIGRVVEGVSVHVLEERLHVF